MTEQNKIILAQFLGCWVYSFDGSLGLTKALKLNCPLRTS